MQEVIYYLVNGRNFHLLLYENAFVILTIVFQIVCYEYRLSGSFTLISWILMFVGFVYVTSWAIVTLFKELYSFFEEGGFLPTILTSIAVMVVFSMFLWAIAFDPKTKARLTSLECSCIVALEYLLMAAQKMTISSSTSSINRINILFITSIIIVAAMMSNNKGRKDLIYSCICSAIALALYSTFEYIVGIRRDMVKGRFETLFVLYILPSVIIGYVFLIIKMRYYIIPEQQHNR